MKNLKIGLIFLFTALIMSCNDGQLIDQSVKHRGALMNLMSGNLEATASLDSLQTLPHLYALGALENLDGEIQIFDGKSYISKAGVDQSVTIESNYNHNAALLVYAQVPEWSSPISLNEFGNLTQLEEQIKASAINVGIDVEKPFPFLIKGTASTLKWHVIHWKEGDMVHTHKKHQESGSYGVLENEDVDIIGFYSENHKAVFTHHTTFLHMHFKNNEEHAIAGHVDGITGNKLELFLSK